MTTILALLGFAALFALAGFFALHADHAAARGCGACEQPSNACGSCPLAPTASADDGDVPSRRGGA